MDVLGILKEKFGFQSFRPGQKEIIEKIIDNKDVCAVMPTGAGKSLCYQLPILAKSGYALIVSPLISLMKDQVDSLNVKGIPATFINSSLTQDQQRERLDKVSKGTSKLLYVAPERFKAPSFSRLLEQAPPQILVVDEAHCISHWGHDFRPDYLRIGNAVREIDIPQICAFTATATPAVQQDIRRSLERPSMEVMVAGFKRPNLAFSVLPAKNTEAKLTKLQTILKAPGPSIIYTSTRKAVEEIRDELGCLAYHAGMDKSERARVHNEFMQQDNPVLAATNAFGMGIDREDVRRVIHYNMPGSLEAYYQEAGRAGRDGDPADCILFYSWRDRHIQEFLIDMNNPAPETIREVYQSLLEQTRAIGSNTLEMSLAELKELIPNAKSEGHVGTALRILERHGLVERGVSGRNQGTLRMLEQIDEVRRVHQHESTQRSRFLHRCASRYGEALQNGVDVSLNDLTNIVGLREDQIKRVLRALNNDALEWIPPFAGRAIVLTQPEITVPELDDAQLHKKREADFQKLENVIDYAETKSCRQRYLVLHFGENAEGWTCGQCDLCNSLCTSFHRTPSKSEFEAIKAVLQTVQLMNSRYGRQRVVKFLLGEESPFHDDESEGTSGSTLYGVLAEYRKQEVFGILDSLHKNGSIRIDDSSGYPCVSITNAGYSVLRGNTVIHVDFPDLTDSQKTNTARKRADKQTQQASTELASSEKADTDNNDLFEKLRQARKELASEKQVPAYQILSDRALQGLAEQTPATASESTKIHGIGRIKAKTVVPRLLEEIAQWRHENN